MAHTSQQGLLITVSAMLIAGCSDKPPSAWSGYAEGDFLYIAAPLAGRLDRVAVTAGQQVARGAPLFAQEAENEQAARDEAAARLNSARAQAANLDKGKRAEELRIAQAQRPRPRPTPPWRSTTCNASSNCWRKASCHVPGWTMRQAC